MPNVRSILQSVFEHPSLRAAHQALGNGQAVVSLCGLTRTAKALVIAGLARKLGRPLVVVTSDNEVAEELREATSTFLGWLTGGASPAAVGVLPGLDCLPYDGRSPHPDISERRAVALWNVAHGRTSILIAPLEAALGRFRDKSYYASLAVELKTGDELSMEDLAEHLAGVGYEKGEPVREVGQFSVRGGIVDVFPPDAPWPVRIEFFGDSIESIREFDPDSQRSRQPTGTSPHPASALLLPLSESRRSGRMFEAIAKALIERARTRERERKRPRADAEPSWALSVSREFPGWEFFVPLAEPHPHSLFSLFGQPIVVWDELAERERQLQQFLENLQARYDEIRDAEPPPHAPGDFFLTAPELAAASEKLPRLALKELGLGAGGEFNFATQPSPKFHGDVKALAADLRSRLDRAEIVTLVFPSGGKLDRMREVLSEYKLPFETLAASPAEANPASAPAAPKSSAGAEDLAGRVLLVRGEIESGVVLPELRLALITDRDMFGGFAWGAPARKERSAVSSFISDLSDLKAGDYVVHMDHGIGLYHGLRQLAVEGSARDFMLLTYQDDARLYVPLERLDLVEKYRAGGDGAKPHLDRLGGLTWARTKTRVKRALRDMAEELLRLYAERKMRGGVAYSPDTPWQKEFEDAFQFEETPDQVTSLADLKRDLESPQPMDRLLCGDVGYGKTELAMRAAFKVAQDGKQVAVLAPTTVLAFQHFTTFRQRMAPFPIRIEMLSRFRTGAEQKKIVEETEAGRVDVVIGTHRLLSKDVAFRDLGLLVVDEEQRFGVAAKEKLKKLRANVDVLTMSATPIPRTLHMAVGGLRDLSVIETPPRGRLAIQTIVAPFSDGLVQSAILQEMHRDGQVYFVHNRVESIFSMAALIQRLVPTARIGVAHGQMGERELERVFLRFIQGEYDVLAATALIENGLDIPRANTLIVNHADRFGLADLYQLRGRVGRSSRRAYAYFLIPAEDALTPLARRRLAALKEFSDLGAGFRLAALDLELRGAGNLLGAEQSGHLNAIGIDLYLQMLEQTVEELKGVPAKPEVRTTLNLGMDIRIPEAYIPDENQRLRMYKRISSLAAPEARGELESELADRFGPVPTSVANLLSYAQLKSVAEGLLVQSVERKGDEVWVRFHEQAPVDAGRLATFVRRRRGAQMRPDGTLRFRASAAATGLPEAIANALREIGA
jgi:transcription-repair coupling factor (superfamily II helicase)